MSLVAREVANRLPSTASGSVSRANKVRSVTKKSAERLGQSNVQRRAYATTPEAQWDAEDVSLLGSYNGTQFIDL